MSTYTRILRATAALSLAGSSLLRAQAPSAQPITFDDAVKIALQKNNAVRLAENAAALDATTVTQQKLSFLPDLRASTSTSESVGRNFSTNDGRIIDQTSQSMSAGLSSSVTLFDGFRNVSALQQAKLDEKASGQDLTRARQTAVFTVARNFLALVTQQEQLRVQNENLAALAAEEAQIQKFVDAGVRPISDLYQQRANVASARASVVDANNATENAKVDLIETLQLDPRATYDFRAPTVSDPTTTARAYDLDSLVTRALATRPDLDASETRVDAAAQGVRQASASRWPTISLSAGYNTAFSSAADAALLSQLNDRRGGSIGIGISIPLFDKGSASLATQRAQIQADNAELALSTQRQAVALDVRRAYLDFQAAQARLDAASAQLEAAQAALDASNQRYAAGKATLVEVTQARATQVQAASALVGAKYTLAFQQAVMSYYTGEMDPTNVKLG
jgi:outer membrane protein